MSRWVTLFAAFSIPIFTAGQSLADKIYFIGIDSDGDERGTINRCNLDGSDWEVLRPGVSTSSVPIAVDSIGEQVYWREGDLIMRSDLDISEPEAYADADGIGSLAIDGEGGWVYLAGGGLWRSPVEDGFLREQILDGRMRSVVLDVPGSTMYWTDLNRFGVEDVWRSDLDGNDAELIVDTSSLTGDLGVGFDSVGRRIYWAAVSYGAAFGSVCVRRANSDGSQVEEVACMDLGLDDYPTYMTLGLLNRAVYFANLETAGLFRVRMDGSGGEEILPAVVLGLALYQSSPETAPFRRGDCNDDGAVDIADPVATLFAVFLGDIDITCDDACDSNDDGVVDVSDPIATLSHLFLGDPAVSPAPGTKECGVDPTEDGLDCDSYVECGVQ